MQIFIDVSIIKVQTLKNSVVFQTKFPNERDDEKSKSMLGVSTLL